MSLNKLEIKEENRMQEPIRPPAPGSFCVRGLVLIALLLLFAGADSVCAQSEDRDNPTALGANTITGAGAGKKVEYYYSFNAGPGEVVITIDLKARDGATSAEVELFDSDANKIFYYYPNATTKSERSVKRLKLSGKQTLTLRLSLDSSAGEYAIKLGGAVELTASDMSGGGAPSVPDPAVTSVPPVGMDQVLPTENTSQPDASAIATAVSGQKPNKGSKLDLGIDLLQTVGTHFALPTSGMLHIVMKDGTTQDIDLSKVKSAKVNKQ